MSFHETNDLGEFSTAHAGDFRSLVASPLVSVGLAWTPAQGNRVSPYVRFGFKRFLDIVIASVVFALILPLLPLTILALIWQDGPSVIFRQPRVGLNGSIFQCLKFRSMARDAEDRLKQLLQTCALSRDEWRSSQKLRTDPRIHPIGNILRKSSIDEIPQLLNVLKGEMSIVGPRPILPEQASLYGDSIHVYSSVRPGITGLWQVSGRSRLTFDDRVKLDARYAEEVTFLGDLKILTKTVRVVLLGDGSC